MVQPGNPKGIRGSALASDEFNEAVARLGGYDVSETGKGEVVDAVPGSA